MAEQNPKKFQHQPAIVELLNPRLILDVFLPDTSVHSRRCR